MTRYDDVIDGAIEMMVEAFEDYANEGGIGAMALEAREDIAAFCEVAYDGMLRNTGVS